ncbi:MAG: type II toxin-antitoxin system RelE/ParE family toxin, partial [Rickettsiales bacterium]
AMAEIYDYITSDNVNVFRTWLGSLKDAQAYVRITRRIMLLERGGFGDCKPLQEGVWELRIDHGPGYRVYYGMIGKKIVLLLCAGDKRTQRRDIESAVAYFADYKRRLI